jgi:hypothetical protein
MRCRYHGVDRIRAGTQLCAGATARAPGAAITAVAADGTGDKVLTGTTAGQVQPLDFSGGPPTELGEAVASGADFRGAVDNDVSFTVYRPQALSPGVRASLLVFAHRTELIAEPGRAPVDPVKQVEDMARAHFGDMPVRRSSEDSRSGIFRGAGLRSPCSGSAVTACNARVSGG